METLWSDAYRQYLCYDRVTKAQIDSPSVGGLIPAFAPIAPNRAAAIARAYRRVGEPGDLPDPEP